MMTSPLDETSPIQMSQRQLPTIDGYRITGVLGQGGMGIVYRAVQTKLNRAVALKVLPAMIGSASPSAVARFRREATAAARLHHSHIVPVYDFGESRDAYFYAMELIDGQPLHDLIKRFAAAGLPTATQAKVAEIVQSSVSEGSKDSHPLHHEAPSELAAPGSGSSAAISTTGRGKPYYQLVAKWIADAADALHYAHGQGIIHRDVKPANLILCNDGRIMLTDFGLAKSDEDQSVTATGALIGTVRYLSPEQAMAKRVSVDHRTDIYSLGAVLYELLCFQPAFPGSDDKQILASIITRDPVSPKKLVSQVPIDLETICLKMLEKSPDVRYPTARAVAEDLRRYVQDLPIIGKRPGLVRRAAKFARRHRAATVAVLSLLAISCMSSLAYYERSRRRVEKVERLVEQGRNLHDNGLLSEARSLYEEALIVDPASPRALGNLARLKKDLYNASSDKPQSLLFEALSHCDAALASVRHDEVARVNSLLNIKGVVQKMLGRYEDAVQTYRTAKDLDPTNPVVWDNLGVVQALTQDFVSARQSFERGIRLTEVAKSCNAASLRNFASLLFYLGEPAAVEMIDRSIACKRDDPAARALRARILALSLDSAQRQQSMIDLQTAIELTDGADGLVERAVAIVSWHMHDCPRALEAAEAAIRLSSGSPLVRRVIAACALRDGDESRADEHGGAAGSLHDTESAAALGPWVEAPKGILWIESGLDLPRP